MINLEFVSAQFRLQLIKRMHEYYGHIGVAQLREKIRRYYYFKRLDKLIEDYCASCSICEENKKRRGRLIRLMSKFGPAKEPYEIVSVDSVGGFGGNRSPKKFILDILVDHFSRYVWISTTTRQCARDIIKLIKPIAQNRQIKLLLADQYTALKSEELMRYLDKMNIKY